jgi:hypothetical protein
MAGTGLCGIEYAGRTLCAHRAATAETGSQFGRAPPVAVFPKLLSQAGERAGNR